jgi:uncharacterized membrane protein HdeD (DUF308 family)
MKEFGNIKETLKSVRNTNILVIIATVAIGLIYIFSPVPAMEVVCYIVAAAMCIYGVFAFVEYFVKPKTEAFGSFGLVKGMTLVVFGVFIFLNPFFVANMLATLVGIAMIIDGVVKAQYSIDLLRLKSDAWWWKYTSTQGIKYTVKVNIVSRTADSVTIEILWTNTIMKAYYGYGQYFDMTIGDKSTGKQTIATSSKWNESSGTNHNESVTKKVTLTITGLSATTTSLSYKATPSAQSDGAHPSAFSGTITIPTY